MLTDPADAAWLEDPAWSGARGALAAAGARVVSVPVDDAGLDTMQEVAAAPDARLV